MPTTIDDLMHRSLHLEYPTTRSSASIRRRGSSHLSHVIGIMMPVSAYGLRDRHNRVALWRSLEDESGSIGCARASCGSDINSVPLNGIRFNKHRPSRARFHSVQARTPPKPVPHRGTLGGVSRPFSLFVAIFTARNRHRERNARGGQHRRSSSEDGP